MVLLAIFLNKIHLFFLFKANFVTSSNLKYETKFKLIRMGKKGEVRDHLPTDYEHRHRV